MALLYTATAVHEDEAERNPNGAWRKASEAWRKASEAWRKASEAWRIIHIE